MSGTNSLVAQGTLNRLRCSLVFSSYPSLNITAAYMGQSFATISFSDPFVDQIGTGTGIVNSPTPYVMASITTTILKTQSLSASWRQQAEATSIVGDVIIYPDSASLPSFTVNSGALTAFNPATFDGKDPTVAMTIGGVYYINNNLWSLT